MEFSIDYFKNLSNEELIDVLFELEYKRKEFNFIKNELPNEVMFKTFINIDEYNQYFTKDVSNRLYGYPYYDEKNDSTYTKEYLGIKNKPTKGFYWEIIPKKKEKLFGLISIKLPLIKVDSVTKEKMEKVVSKYHYYYDFGKELYIEVDTSDHKSSDVALFNNLKEVSGYIYHRLGKMEHSYLDIIEPAFKHYRARKSGNKESILKLLDKYITFLSEIPIHLRVKLLFGKISKLEYDFLLSKIKETKQECIERKEKIEQGNSDLYYKGLLFEEELSSNFELVKPTSFSKEKKPGYFEDEQGVFVPNLVLIEMQISDKIKCLSCHSENIFYTTVQAQSPFVKRAIFDFSDDVIIGVKNNEEHKPFRATVCKDCGFVSLNIRL